MKKVLVLVFLSVFISSSGFAALINPDFETGDLTGWNIIKSSGLIYARMFDVTGNGNTSWASCFWYSGLGDNGISQPLETETGELFVSLDVAVHFQGGGSWSDPVRLFVDDTEIYTVGKAYYRNGQKKRYDISVSTFVDAGIHTLKLVVDNPGHPEYFSYYSDNWQTSFEPVPIPAAFWLLGSGLIGLAGIRRKSGKAGLPA